MRSRLIPAVVALALALSACGTGLLERPAEPPVAPEEAPPPAKQAAPEAAAPKPVQEAVVTPLEPQAPGAPPVAAPVPPVSPVTPAPTEPAAPPALPEPRRGEPHIALMLPLASSAFRAPAEAVRQGFMAASRAQADGLPVRVYDTGEGEEGAQGAFETAVREGCTVAVGPLTRNAVLRLLQAGTPAVPVLTLNTPDLDHAPPPGFYLFGVSLEAEARQVARTAFAEGGPVALTVSAEHPLAQRVQKAFAAEWRRLGGRIERQFVFSTGAASFQSLRESILKHSADVLFLSADAQRARLVRPYLITQIPTYAVSQTYAGVADSYLNVDLNRVRFVDMPWMLQPDHPAVMVYAHPQPPLAADLERLYALGVDARRLAGMLAAGHAPREHPLDGVTGNVSLRDGYLLERRLPMAEFTEGLVAVLEEAPR